MGCVQAAERGDDDPIEGARQLLEAQFPAMKGAYPMAPSPKVNSR